MALAIRPLTGEGIEWDAFVRSAPGRSPFHLLACKRAVEPTFGHRAHGIEGIFVAHAGYRVFDFGRSREGTGPYNFKRHCGFEPVPLPYQYVLLDALSRHAPARPGADPLSPLTWTAQ